MEKQLLVQDIYDRLSLGESEQHIRNQLVSEGLSEDDINEAFERIENPKGPERIAFWDTQFIPMFPQIVGTRLLRKLERVIADFVTKGIKRLFVRK